MNMSEKFRTSNLYGLKAYKRSVNDTRLERDMGYGRLYDHHKHKRVEVFWDLDPESKKKRLFKMRVGEETIVLDAEQVMQFLRWV